VYRDDEVVLGPLDNADKVTPRLREVEAVPVKTLDVEFG
jgi:hypothetical protein